MKTLPALFLLFIMSSNVFAETNDAPANLQEYDIEVIIFEDAHARYINSEIWNQNNTNEPDVSKTFGTKASTENLDKLSQKEINRTSFKTIKPTILNKEYQRIKNSSEYNVLFYGAWRQAGLSDADTININMNDLDNTAKSTSENTITGNFKLILARYLHIYAELNYQRKANNEASANSIDVVTSNPAPDAEQNNNLNNGLTIENKPYPITIHRRMRSKELHYIDHPLVGMLIQINPVEKAKTQ
jgi:hypothetical protein